jgi:hypothetical protein
VRPAALESGASGSIFWHQAVIANQVAKMLDGKQRDIALIAQRPEESDIAFKDRRANIRAWRLRI